MIYSWTFIVSHFVDKYWSIYVGIKNLHLNWIKILILALNEYANIFFFGNIRVLFEFEFDATVK